MQYPLEVLVTRILPKSEFHPADMTVAPSS